MIGLTFGVLTVIDDKRNRNCHLESYPKALKEIVNVEQEDGEVQKLKQGFAAYSLEHSSSSQVYMNDEIDSREKANEEAR